MTTSTAATNLIGWQALANSATLTDLIAWQARHRKSADESVGSFLERSLSLRDASLSEGKHASVEMIVATSDLDGPEPFARIFEETSRALQTDEQFGSGFFDGPTKWIVGDKLGDILAEVDLHRNLATTAKALVQAALDGRLSLFDDCYLAVIRAADISLVGSQPS